MICYNLLIIFIKLNDFEILLFMFISKYLLILLYRLIYALATTISYYLILLLSDFFDSLTQLMTVVKGSLHLQKLLINLESLLVFLSS